MRNTKRILLTMAILLLSVTMFAPKTPAINDRHVKMQLYQRIQNIANQTIMGKNKEFRLLSMERNHLFKNVYEYTMIFKVGNHEYDKLGLHRVVKEIAPYLPIFSKNAVMLIHGDTANFNTAFLPTSANKSAEDSPAGYLAKNGIDVWGIDLRWTFVPDDTCYFSFMKDWNTAFHLQDIKLAVNFVRKLRMFTGNGDEKLFLIGHSRGAQYTYAYANDDSQLPKFKQDLKGIIPIDLIIKAAPENTQLRDTALATYQLYKTMYDSGQYYNNEGASLKFIANLAETAPDELSPLIPDLTNKQTALYLLAATYATYETPEECYPPSYHFNAGTFDENQIATGLQYANFNYVIEIALNTPSYQSIGEIIDGQALISGAVDLPYDDHFREIKIPVFYIGAAGGEGEEGKYTLSLLGGTDKTSLLIKLYPSGYEAIDYGHADLLWADNARSLVWKPILNWLRKH